MLQTDLERSRRLAQSLCQPVWLWKSYLSVDLLVGAAGQTPDSRTWARARIPSGTELRLLGDLGRRDLLRRPKGWPLPRPREQSPWGGSRLGAQGRAGTGRTSRSHVIPGSKPQREAHVSRVEASFPSSSTLRFRGRSCPSAHVWAVGKAGTLHPAHGPPHVPEISWLFLRERVPSSRPATAGDVSAARRVCCPWLRCASQMLCFCKL